MTLPRVVAVTGGSGQLGTHVLRRLIADPAVERVISIDPRPPIVASPKLQVITGDVRDPNLADSLLGADALIHCAFIISGGERSPLFRAVNVEGSKNVFHAAVAAGVKTISFVSSITAYGVVQGHPVPIVESTPRVRQADFAYACCKYDVEAFLDEVEPLHPDIAVSRIRANVLMGRRMQHLLSLILRIGWIPDLGFPLAIVWDEDVADLLVEAVRRRARGAFNATADELLSSTELAEKTGSTAVRIWRVVLLAHMAVYALTSRLNLHVLPDPAWVTKTSAPLIGSSERAKRELGWSPRFPTAVSVVQHYREVAPWRLDVRLLLVLWMLSRAVRDAPESLGGRSARIYLCLNGWVAGDFGLIVEHGRLRVHAGAPTMPTSTVTMTSALFRDLIAGRATLDEAFAPGGIDWFGADADRDVFRRIVALAGERRKNPWHGVATRLAARWR